MMNDDTVVYRPTKKTKTAVAFLGTTLMLLTAAFGDDAFSWAETQEFATLLIEGGATVWGVFQIRNDPK